MATTISGTSGVTYPAGGTDNTAGAGVGTTDTQTLTNKTLSSPAITGTPVMGASVITSGTAVASTSGTSIDFTGIPSWVKRITVLFSGVSVSATSNILVQLGDSGGIETTGYTSVVGNNANTTTSTAGFIATSNGAAASVLSGRMTITLISTNAWVSSTVLGDTTNTQTPYAGGGAKSTSDTLDRVRITTVNGTDTFDAGSINILYE
jgi:hypothetical protein